MTCRHTWAKAHGLPSCPVCRVPVPVVLPRPALARGDTEALAEADAARSAATPPERRSKGGNG